MGNIHFGAVLRDRRRIKGWTQEQLATQADLSARYVQSMEADEKIPSLETVFRLARAFNTSPGPLLDPLWRAWRDDQ